MASRSRSGRGAPVGGMIAVLVLVVILAGLIYGFWDDIRARFAEPEIVEEPISAEPVEIARPEPPLSPAARRPELPPEVEKPGPKRTRIQDRAAAARKRKADRSRIEAEAALRALDFKRAAMLYNTAALALEEVDDGTDAAAEFKNLSAKTLTFGTLTAAVELNPEAKGDVAILHLDMSDIEVVIVEETPEAYIVARKGGIRVEIPKEDVRSVERVSKDKYRKQSLAGIEKAEREMKEHSGVAYCLLAERAFKEGLAEKTVEYLDMAYALDGEDLPARVRRYEAGQFLYRAHWSESTGRARTARMWCMKLERLYPDVGELVEEARELRRRIAEREAVERGRGTPRPTVVIKVRETRPSRTASLTSKRAPAGAAEEVDVRIDKVRSSSGRHAKTIEKANRLFAEAMGHYVKGRPGNPNSNRHLTLAASGFDQVVNLCEKALRDEPTNSAVRSRQQDASRYAYHARKMKTLSVRR